MQKRSLRETVHRGCLFRQNWCMDRPLDLEIRIVIQDRVFVFRSIKISGFVDKLGLLARLLEDDLGSARLRARLRCSFAV
jgi:hypothetical protein